MPRNKSHSANIREKRETGMLNDNDNNMNIEYEEESEEEMAAGFQSNPFNTLNYNLESK